MTEKHVGKVIQVMGAVLDIRFQEGELPSLLNAISIQLRGSYQLHGLGNLHGILDALNAEFH